MRIFRNSLLLLSLTAAAVISGPYAYGVWLLVNYKPAVRHPAPLQTIVFPGSDTRYDMAGGFSIHYKTRPSASVNTACDCDHGEPEFTIARTR